MACSKTANPGSEVAKAMMKKIVEKFFSYKHHEQHKVINF